MQQHGEAEKEAENRGRGKGEGGRGKGSGRGTIKSVLARVPFTFFKFCGLE